MINHGHKKPRHFFWFCGILVKEIRQYEFFGKISLTNNTGKNLNQQVITRQFIKFLLSLMIIDVHLIEFHGMFFCIWTT